MDKLNFEKLDDNFINLYEEGIFIRCFEWSAIKLNEIFEYKLILSVDKKTNFLYFELGFPKSKLEQNLEKILSLGYNVRFFSKHSNPNIYNGNMIFDKNEELIVVKKQNLIKFI